MSNTNFNDLTDQFAQNLIANPTGPSHTQYNNRTPNEHTINSNGFDPGPNRTVNQNSGSLPAMNASKGLRGFSRSSKNSQMSQRGAINTGSNQLSRVSREYYPGVASQSNQQVNTAGSQKRSSNQNFSGSGTVEGGAAELQNNHEISLNNQVGLPPSSKRSALHGQQSQKLEYLPIQTMSYASQRNQQSGQDDETAVKDNTEMRMISSGVGKLNALNEGLYHNIAETEIPQMGTKDSSVDGISGGYNPLRTEISSTTQDKLTNKFNDFMNHNNNDKNKSKSNISLMGNNQLNSNQVSNENSDMAINAQSMGIPLRGPGMNDLKLGKLSKYQMKVPLHSNSLNAQSTNQQTNFMDKRISNKESASRLMMNENNELLQSKASTLGANGELQYNLKTKGGLPPHPSHGHQGSTMAISTLDKKYVSNDQHQSSNRKLSLAAKAGQMQIFNSIITQNLNQPNQMNQGQDQTGDSQWNNRTSQKQNSLPPAYNNKNHSQHHFHLNQIEKQQIMNSPNFRDIDVVGGGQNIKNEESNNTLPTSGQGSRQFESYLGRKEIIQQQRQKKQELLMQLDMGMAPSNRLPLKRQGNTNQTLLEINTSKELAIKETQVIQEDEQNGGVPNLSINGVSPTGLVRRNSNQRVIHEAKNSVFNDPNSENYNMFGGINTSPGQLQRGPNPLMPIGQQQNHLKNNKSYQNEQALDKMNFKPIPQQQNTMINNNWQNHKQSPLIKNGLQINTQGSQIPNMNNGSSLNQYQNTYEFAHYAQQQFTSPQSQQHPDNKSITQGINGVSLGIGGQQIQTVLNQNNAQQPTNADFQIQQMQAQETTAFNKDLKIMVKKISDNNNPSAINSLAFNLQNKSNEQTNSQQIVNPINNRITRKLEGGRPHKVYDYMFIQMSNEQFQKEYDGKKIFITKTEDESRSYSPIKQPNDMSKKLKFTSPDKTPGQKFGKLNPLNPGVSPGFDQPNLNGLVQIKAYESMLTDELPSLQCNLIPTQLDHLKVLVCEQEDKNYPKLLPEAQLRFEHEKQNQIKQYMEDIISKLQQKDRRFKVTVKKKFIDDALYNSTSIRVASVYVIVVNREKTYDQFLTQKSYKASKKMSDNNIQNQSSSDEDGLQIVQPGEQSVLNMRSQSFANGKKRSMYDSDTNGPSMKNAKDQLNSTSTSSNVPQFQRLIQDKQKEEGERVMQKKNSVKISTGPTFKRSIKKPDEDIAAYKYVTPIKEYPAKYGPTKIRIIQNLQEYNHHQKHPINIFFNQYNEFIKLVFKNQKQTTASKLNLSYVLGLSRALGLNLKKEAFSENNLKSRDHINMLKEKLIYQYYKKVNDENKDRTLIQQQQQAEKPQISNADIDVDTETLADSSSNYNNTPKSKNLAILKEKDSISLSGDNASGIQMAPPKVIDIPHQVSFIVPPQNIIYKYFIGKGNNSIMVRSLFKNRYWWVQHDKEEMEKTNFCWTQIKRNNLMEALPCKYPHKKSGVKNTSSFSQGQNLLQATPQSKSSKKKKQQNIITQKSSQLIVKTDKVINSNVQQNESIMAKLMDIKVYNKIEDNFHMNNKKALFLNMVNYYEATDKPVWDNLPVTFHVKDGMDDPEFQRFKNYYDRAEEEVKNAKAQRRQKIKDAAEQKLKQNEENDEFSPKQSPEVVKDAATKAEEPQFYASAQPTRNIWIIKPGENTNRGTGIQVAREFSEIKQIIEDSTVSRRRTCIVQKYIHNPLLINRRKFDIRTYVLMTSVNGNHKTYIYEEGYLRTSCREYSINNLSNRLVHLTNDAVQKRAEDYGKYEPGNKISYNEFQIYLDKNYPDLNVHFERDIKSQMNKLTTDIFRACHGKLDPKKRTHCMEVFGLDFMIDDEFRPFLIEVNTNPCLELSCPLLARLIPNMLENSLKLSMDTIFIPPDGFSSKKAFIGDSAPDNRFELVFDSTIDGPVLDKLFQTKNNIIIEMDEDELSEEEEHDDDE